MDAQFDCTASQTFPDEACFNHLRCSYCNIAYVGGRDTPQCNDCKC